MGIRRATRGLVRLQSHLKRVKGLRLEEEADRVSWLRVVRWIWGRWASLIERGQ